MAIPAINVLGNPNVTEGNFQIAIEDLRKSVIGSGKAYDSANTYSQYDTCVSGGIVYYSKINSNTGNTPAVDANWGLIGGLITGVVHNVGNETIAGTKTFSTSPIVPTPIAGDNSTTVATTGFVNSAVGITNSPLVKTALNATGNAPIYACRAWVNFNGTGTIAIRASGNVSSITDNGAGKYTVNFTTPMPDTNYSAQAAHAAFGPGNPFGIVVNNDENKTISSIDIGTVYNNDYNDVSDVNVSIIR